VEPTPDHAPLLTLAEQGEAVAIEQRQHPVVVGVDPLCAALGVLALVERRSNRAGSAAHAPASFDQRDLATGRPQVGSCRETRQPGTDNHDTHVRQLPVSVAAILEESSPPRRKISEARTRASKVTPMSMVAIDATSGLRTVRASPNT